MRGRDQLLASLSTHFKIESHRLGTEASDVNTHFQKIIQPRSTMEVTLEMHTREPDLQLVEHHSVMKTNFTKEFCLGKLEEVNVSAVEDDARRIDIAPAHALFDSEFFV